MAKRQSKETFAEMLAKLTAEKVAAKKIEAIEERKYFLIVCEGIRTEPIYFEYLKRFLPKHLLETWNKYMMAQPLRTLVLQRECTF